MAWPYFGHQTELVWENCFRVKVTQGKAAGSVPAFVASKKAEHGLSLFHSSCLGNCLPLFIKKGCKLVHFSTALEEKRLSAEHVRRVALCQDEELSGASQACLNPLHNCEIVGILLRSCAPRTQCACIERHSPCTESCFLSKDKIMP